MRRPLTTLLLLVIARTAFAQTTASIRVDARCVDPTGKPIAGVVLADAWGMVGDAWVWSFVCPNPEVPLTLVSDEDGRVRGRWTLSPFGTPLLAWSADRSLARFVPADFDEATHEGQILGELRLLPVVRVHGAIRSPAARQGCRLGLNFGHLDSADHPWEMSFCFAIDGRTIDVPLPPGRYELWVSAGFGQAPPRALVLEPGRRELDLGTLDVPARAFDLPGEVLPDWHVDQARNLALEDATLAHFRGKPLLVHFAEYGNPPHLDQADRERLGALATHPQRDRFAVALFGPTTDFLAALPPRQPNPEFDRIFPPPKPPEPRVESMFPVLTDSIGTTASRYGCSWGTIVVDGDGRLLIHGSLTEAIARLERELATSKATSEKAK